VRLVAHDHAQADRRLGRDRACTGCHALILDSTRLGALAWGS
jgi:hypothetical protein